MADLVIVPSTGDTLACGRLAKPIKEVVTDGNVYTAGEIINGGRAIFIAADGLAYMADNTVLSEVKAVIGISYGSAAMGAALRVQTENLISEATWTWTPGSRVYFDNLGMLTGSAPATGHIRSVGVARTATTILVNVGEIIAR